MNAVEKVVFACFGALVLLGGKSFAGEPNELRFSCEIPTASRGADSTDEILTIDGASKINLNPRSVLEDNVCYGFSVDKMREFSICVTARLMDGANSEEANVALDIVLDSRSNKNSSSYKAKIPLHKFNQKPSEAAEVVLSVDGIKTTLSCIGQVIQ